MGGNLAQLFKLWGIYARLDLTWFLRDTKYCLMAIVADLISNISAIAAVFLLAERFGNIGGMSRDQILFMLGYACVIDGVILMFFSMNNIAWISRLIGRGQLDHRLVQPVPLWMQFATEGFIPVSGNSMLLSGLAVVWVAASRLMLPMGAVWLLLLVGSILCSTAVILSFSYILGSLAFYAPGAGEEISTTAVGLFSALKTFPIGGFSGAAKAVLCTILPVGLAAWLPANVLLGQPPSGLGGALLPAVTLCLVFAASQLFKKGLKHYAKSGSIRYHDRGHRR